MSLPLRNPLDSVSLERALEDLIVRFIINVPPEDLATVERELFHFEEAQWFYTDFVKLTNPHLPNMKFKTFASYVISLCPLVWKWQDVNPEEALQKFSKYKKSIPVRGAAIFNETLNKILLVKGTESDSWSFPRGKISKDEDDVDCCIREVMEEIGFDLTNYVLEDQYIERNIGGKNYKIYLVKGVPQDFAFKPQVRNEIEKIEWRDFWKLSRSIHKSNNKFYLVSSMVKPLSLWVKKQKQIQGEEQLKQYAEEQLKLLLGIGTQEEAADPGRDLLNMLQSSVGQKKPLVFSDDESQASISTSAPTTVPPAPSTADSQSVQPIAAGAYAGYPFPFPQYPIPGMQTINPFQFVQSSHQGVFATHSTFTTSHQYPQAQAPQTQQPVPGAVVYPVQSQLQQAYQPPHTPVVKPSVIEDRAPHSKQLLELLKNPRKPEVEDESTAKTLLKLLKNPTKENRTSANTVPSSKGAVSGPSGGRSISGQSIDTANLPSGMASSMGAKSTAIPLYSPRSSLSEMTLPDEPLGGYEEFESSSEEEQGEELAYMNLQEPTSSVMESNAKVENNTLDNISHVDTSGNLSTRSLQSEKTEKSKPTAKPKIKLLKRGETLTPLTPSISSQTATSESSAAGPTVPSEKDVSSRIQNSQGNELLDVLKSKAQPEPSVASTSPAKELLNTLNKPQGSVYQNLLFGANHRKSDDESSPRHSPVSQQARTHEFLNLLKRPQAKAENEELQSVLLTPPANSGMVQNSSTLPNIPYGNLHQDQAAALLFPQQPPQFQQPYAAPNTNSKELLAILRKPASNQQKQLHEQTPANPVDQPTTLASEQQNLVKQQISNPSQSLQQGTPLQQPQPQHTQSPSNLHVTGNTAAAQELLGMLRKSRVVP
ncbi:FACR270Wp [Eremothecium gossypii FDAG1]|nr:FACR270Wp [Eremothecium gossypii FDAG1]